MQNAEEYEKIYDNLLKTGILIGSKRWGGFRSGSDIDLVFSKSELNKILPKLERNNNLDIKYVGDYSENTMHNIDNIKIEFPRSIHKPVLNIIVYLDQDIEKIKLLNDYMDQFKNTVIGKLIAKNKLNRINIVEMLLDEVFKK